MYDLEAKSHKNGAVFFSYPKHGRLFARRVSREIRIMLQLGQEGIRGLMKLVT